MINFELFTHILSSLDCEKNLVLGKVWPGQAFLSGLLYGTNSRFPGNFVINPKLNDELTWSSLIPDDFFVVNLELFYAGKGYSVVSGELCKYLVTHFDMGETPMRNHGWFVCFMHFPKVSCDFGVSQEFQTWKSWKPA